MNVFKWILIMTTLHSNPVAAKECVILLHGLARSNSSMGKLAKALNDAGYHTINDGYPSTSYKVDKLAEDAISWALAKCPKEATIHFVTHSMGGILVRQYLQVKTIKNLGRVVMLGPPNKGSQVVDKLHKLPGFKLINGPAGMQLGTGELSVSNQLGPAKFEVGIIAGTRSINLILSAMLPNPDDGKVSVENTRLEGMQDHIELPVTHPFMMKNKQVIRQVICFLKNGVFSQ
jgi:pimeloyl-ACP methyl ester carboxylesterase